VNLFFDGDAGTVSGAVFHPANNFAQVGTKMVAQATPGDSVRFGQTAAHGNHPDAMTQSYFDKIIIDYTNAKLPLVPPPFPRSSSTPTPNTNTWRPAKRRCQPIAAFTSRFHSKMPLYHALLPNRGTS
jgi:hypothetical protein